MITELNTVYRAELMKYCSMICVAGQPLFSPNVSEKTMKSVVFHGFLTELQNRIIEQKTALLDTCSGKAVVLC